MRHAAISPKQLNDSLELTSSLESRELKVKGILETKVTTAAKAPCTFQHSPMSLALQEMVFLKSRWHFRFKTCDISLMACLMQPVETWSFRVLSSAAPVPRRCLQPQRTDDSKLWQTLPQTHPSSLPFPQGGSLQGEEHWLMKITWAGPSKSYSHLC